MASIVPVEEKTLAEKLKILDALSNSLNTKNGKVIMGRIGDNEQIRERLKIKYIATPSREINQAVGGGFPRRRCTIIAGKPDSGKTGLVLETIGKNMKEDPNFVAGWLESENSLEGDYLFKTFGIDPERFFVIPVDLKVGAEKTLDYVQSILATGAIDLFCINSLKCLVPTQEMKKSLEEAIVADQARMNARMTRKFTSLIAQHETAFVIITHLTTEIGKISKDPLIVSGGHAIQYWASIVLDLRKRSIKEGEIIPASEGIKVGFSVRKNHCIPSRFPYVKGEYYAVIGEGIETILSSVKTAVEKGVLEMHGAWVWWIKDGEAVEKFNGKGAFRSYMKENPERFAEYLTQIGDSLDNEIEQMSDEEVKAIMAEEAAIQEKVNLDSEIMKKPAKKGKKEKKVA